MRILFLDFDGVLNHAAFLTQQHDKASKGAPPGSLVEACSGMSWRDMIDPDAVGRLDRIVRETGAKVVISSSWRHAHTYQELEALLREKGFSGDVIDQTVDVPDGRVVEIALWVSEHRPEIESWVAIDDANLHALDPNFVQTSFTGGGLTDVEADTAIAILKNPPRRPRLVATGGAA